MTGTQTDDCSWWQDSELIQDHWKTPLNHVIWVIQSLECDPGDETMWTSSYFMCSMLKHQINNILLTNGHSGKNTGQLNNSNIGSVPSVPLTVNQYAQSQVLLSVEFAYHEYTCEFLLWHVKMGDYISHKSCRLFSQTQCRLQDARFSTWLKKG